MNYKKEIDFLLNTKIEVANSATGRWTQSEGDYDYADRRYNSKNTEIKAEFHTNLGAVELDIDITDSKYEEYDGEKGRWCRAKELDFYRVHLQFNGKTKESVTLEEHDSSILLEFIDKFNFHNVVGCAFSEDYKMELYERNESFPHSKIAKPIQVELYNLPKTMLMILSEKSPNIFKDVDLKKLKHLSQATQNTSQPRELLEKIRTLSQSAQASIIYYAMKKTTEEVDKLISREYSNVDPYADYFEYSTP